MLLGLRNRPLILSAQHFTASAGFFAPDANVAAIGRPKMAYPDVENNHKNKRSRRL